MIATPQGWLWIVGVIDCHDRDLIGHRYGVTADTTLCLGSLHDGVCERFDDDLDALKARRTAALRRLGLTVRQAPLQD